MNAAYNDKVYLRNMLTEYGMSQLSQDHHE